MWLTTSRRSVKARAWSVDPSTAGLVRDEDLAVAFTGTVHQYDALDPNTWSETIRDAPRVARATVAFSRKNARFFAGYAMDARQVPFAWTPPGRVFVGVDLARTALLDSHGVQEGWSRWGGTLTSHDTYRVLRKAPSPFDRLPAEVREAIGDCGDAALCLEGSQGPVVVPARWLSDGASLHAALPVETLALAEAGPEVRVALSVDRTSSWRARDMVGAMVQGVGSIFAQDAIETGARSMKAVLRSIDAGASALVRITPSRLVWWSGWSSGSAIVP